MQNLKLFTKISATIQIKKIMFFIKASIFYFMYMIKYMYFLIN